MAKIDIVDLMARVDSQKTPNIEALMARQANDPVRNRDDRPEKQEKPKNQVTPYNQEDRSSWNGHDLQGQAKDITPQRVQIPIGPLRTLDVSKVTDTKTLIQQLNFGLILNDFNLPTYVYRPDLLDFRAFLALSKPDITAEEVEYLQAMLTSALFSLDYFEGYPTFQDGTPFWYQLPFEADDPFVAFNLYAGQQGARNFHEITEFPRTQVAEWYHIYLWQLRARAWDMYKVVHHQRMQALRVIDTEDNHYAIAANMLKKVTHALEGRSLEDLTAFQLVRMADTLAKLQRVSLGMGATDGGDLARLSVPSVEVVMRSISTKSHEEPTDTGKDYNLLRDNPEALETAQELIVQVNTVKQQNSGNR